MSTLTIILVFIAVIITLGAIIYALLRDRKSLKKEITQLTSELYKANQNATNLAKYISQMQEIKSKEKETNNKIKEAKNDEEILSIIADIVNDNNARVRK